MIKHSLIFSVLYQNIGFLLICGQLNTNELSEGEYREVSLLTA